MLTVLISVVSLHPFYLFFAQAVLTLFLLLKHLIYEGSLRKKLKNDKRSTEK